jgi:hypothetical protein
MLDLKSSWDEQLLLGIGISLLYSLFLVWNNEISTTSTICRSEEFAPWTKYITLLLLGGSLSQTSIHFFRIFITSHGFSINGHIRHPKATYTIFFLSIIQSIALLCTFFDLIKHSCEDFLGVRTSPFMWFEWFSYLPLMFFCVSMLDVKRTVPKPIDYMIEFFGGISIVTLFSGNMLSLPHYFVWFFFILSHILMTVAVALQQYEAWKALVACRQEYREMKESVGESFAKEIIDNLQVAKCKMNCNIFISINFTVFPLFYYLKLTHYLTADECYIALLICTFFSKILFSQILLDSHITILDPNKFIILEEKKRSEESKLMFLRYVFHEVRVPLNSLSLGLQLLHDSTTIVPSDMETINMMQEAAHFMTETLNDVLSLQKIEQGMFELEIKPFSPVQMVHSVLNNFR